MPEHKQAAEMLTRPCNEVVARVLAGPETAARLGVAVGTVIEARHTITPLDGSAPLGRVISPDEADVVDTFGRDVLAASQEAN